MLIKSAKFSKPAVSGSMRGVMIFVEVTVALLAEQVATGNVVGMLPLPAGHKLVRGRLFSTDLDTNGTPTVTASVGILNADQDDLEANKDFLTADTVPQAGGVAEFSVSDGLQLAAADSEQVVAVKFDAGAATGADGSITLQLEYAAE